MPVKLPADAAKGEGVNLARMARPADICALSFWERMSSPGRELISQPDHTKPSAGVAVSVSAESICTFVRSTLGVRDTAPPFFGSMSRLRGEGAERRNERSALLSFPARSLAVSLMELRPGLGVRGTLNVPEVARGALLKVLPLRE